MSRRSTSSMALLAQLDSESKTIGIVEAVHAISIDCNNVRETAPPEDCVTCSMRLVSPSAAARRTISDVSWQAVLRTVTSCSVMEHGTRSSSSIKIPIKSTSTNAMQAARRTVALSSETDLSRNISSNSYR